MQSLTAARSESLQGRSDGAPPLNQAWVLPLDVLHSRILTQHHSNPLQPLGDLCRPCSPSPGCSRLTCCTISTWKVLSPCGGARARRMCGEPGGCRIRKHTGDSHLHLIKKALPPCGTKEARRAAASSPGPLAAGIPRQPFSTSRAAARAGHAANPGWSTSTTASTCPTVPAAAPRLATPARTRAGSTRRAQQAHLPRVGDRRTSQPLSEQHEASTRPGLG